MQVAENIHRLGSALVNFFAVVEDDAVTLVDGGVAGYKPQVDRLLASLGRTPRDIRAVILTHAHADHVGVAEIIRKETGATVYVHARDKDLATTAKSMGKNEGSTIPYLRHPAAWRLFAELSRNGGMKPRPIAEVTTFDDGDELDVPGRPRVVHTPGHTDGHVVFAFTQSDAVLVGDALCTYNPLTGDRGAQLLPKALTRKVSQALASLDRIEEIDARHVLVGHGEPFDGGAREAAQRARERGPT